MLARPAVVMLPAWAEETQRSPYDRVATGKPPQRDETVKVYTNSDLEKLFGIVAEEDREAGAADDADERLPESAALSDHLSPRQVVERDVELFARDAAGAVASGEVGAADRLRLAGLGVPPRSR